MNLQTFSQFQPVTITGLNLNMTRKQPCDLKGCTTKSFSRFEMTPQHYHINSRYVCCHCASILSGYNCFNLGHVEQYIKCVKSHFKSLKNRWDYKTVNNHVNKNVIGKLDKTIGDQRVIVTKFNDGNYGLIIDGNPQQPNRYKGFLSYKKVYDHTVKVINNRYEQKLLNFINYGTPFVMP